ncbi:MAG: TonB-dependent receptor [Flavobacteriales bacterium]
MRFSRSSVLALSWVIGFSWAAGKEASGQIQLQSADTGLPIPGATVKADSNWVGTTDANGWFAPPDQTQFVNVGAIGFERLVFKPDTLAANHVVLQPTTYAIGQAVITGQFTGRTDRNAVQNVNILSRSDMDRIGAITLRDVLRTQSGVQISHDPQLGTQLNMLGLSGQHVQVMVDGLPMVGRVNGNIDLDQLSLDVIERIEIIEGPMSVEYGSEAIAGTINLITRKETNPQGSLRWLGESIGRNQAMVSGTKPWGKGWSTQANASFLGFRGSSIADADTARTQAWKPKQQGVGRVKLAHASDQWNFAVTFDGMVERLLLAGPVQYINETRPINDTLLGVYAVPYANDQSFQTQRGTGRFDFKQLTGRGRWEGFVATTNFTRTKTTERINLTDMTSASFTQNGMQATDRFQTWHTRGRYAIQPSSRLQWAIGWDVKHEQLQGERIESGIQSLRSMAGFSAVEWNPHPDWLIRPGLRVMHHSDFKAPWIPSGHVRWRRGKHVVRGSFAKGFRAPDLKERHFLFVDINHNIAGSDDLRAEVSEAVQLSYAVDVLGTKSLWRSSIQAFRNDVQGLIELGLVDAESQLYTYLNLGRVVSQGGSLSLRRMADKWSLNMQATGWTRWVWQSTEMDTPSTAQTLQWSLSADVQLLADWQLSMQWNHQHRDWQMQQTDAGEWVQSALGPNPQFSAFLSGNFGASKDFRLQIGMDNILNITTRSSTMPSVPATGEAHTGSESQWVAMGRTGRITLQWNFR